MLGNKFQLKDGKIYCRVKKDDIYVGNAIKIIKHSYDLDTGHYTITIEFEDCFAKRKVSITIRRDELSASILEKMIKKNGGIINDGRLMLKYLEEMETRLVAGEKPSGQTRVDLNGDKYIVDDFNLKDVELNIVHRYSDIGWKIASDRIIFQGYKVYPENEVTSAYGGLLKIHSNGSIEKYKEMLQKNIIGNTPLESIMAIAASSTVLGYANIIWNKNLLNTVIHLYGNSTTGKTTVAMLMASFGGCPDSGQRESLFLTFNGTNNATIKKLSTNTGYPVCIDEFGLSTSKDVSQFLYSLADGSERERLSRNGSSLQKRAEFKTNILTNGECSILDKSNGNEGLRARVLELVNIPWTKDATSSDNIKTTVLNNYGFITPMIAEHLLGIHKNDEDEEWKQKYDSWVNRFISEARSGHTFVNITDRVAKTLALFMVSAELLKAILNLELDIEEIFRFFFKQVIKKISAEAEIGKRAYLHILAYYAENKGNFVKYGKNKEDFIGKMSSYKGMIMNTKFDYNIKDVIYNRVLCLTLNQAKYILEKSGFSDVKICMEEINKMGLLKTKDKARTTGNFKFWGEDCVGYKILFPRTSDITMSLCLDEEEDEQGIKNEENMDN